MHHPTQKMEAHTAAFVTRHSWGTGWNRIGKLRRQPSPLLPRTSLAMPKLECIWTHKSK